VLSAAIGLYHELTIGYLTQLSVCISERGQRAVRESGGCAFNA